MLSQWAWVISLGDPSEFLLQPADSIFCRYHNTWCWAPTYITKRGICGRERPSVIMNNCISSDMTLTTTYGKRGRVNLLSSCLIYEFLEASGRPFCGKQDVRMDRSLICSRYFLSLFCFYEFWIAKNQKYSVRCLPPDGHFTIKEYLHI